MNHVLESLHETCDHYTWAIQVTVQLGCSSWLTLEYITQYAKAAFPTYRSKAFDENKQNSR